MEKPNFIKIFIPVAKVQRTKTIEQFYMSLKNQFVEVIFSNIRQKKIYSYKIENVQHTAHTKDNPKSKKLGYQIILIKK